MSLEEVMNKVISKISNYTSLSREEINNQLQAKITEVNLAVDEVGAALIVADEVGIKIQEEMYQYLRALANQSCSINNKILGIVGKWLCGSDEYLFKVLHILEKEQRIGHFYYNKLTINGINISADDLTTIDVELNEPDLEVLKSLETTLGKPIPYVKNFDDDYYGDMDKEYMSYDPEGYGMDPDVDPEVYQLKFGFKCANGHITELALRNQGLTSLPTNIGLLERLKLLDLQHNSLKTLPESFTQLSSLEMLDLSNNQLEYLPPSFQIKGGWIGTHPVYYDYDLNLTGNPLKLICLIPLLKLEQKGLNIQYSAELLTLPFIRRTNFKSLTLVDQVCRACGMSPVVAGKTNVTQQDQVFCANCEQLISTTTISSAIQQKLDTKLGIFEIDLGMELPPLKGAIDTTSFGFVEERNEITGLGLYRMPLHTLPQSIGHFIHLQVLNLSFTQLTQLPAVIEKLTKLQRLMIGHAHLMTLPNWIGNLVTLRTLTLDFNQLTSLPESIGQLVNLEQLNIRRNQLTELPESIGQLINLERLDLEGNPLTSLPEKIGNLTKLKSLDLTNTKVTSLPESFWQLKNLETLRDDYTPLAKSSHIQDQIDNLLSVVTFKNRRIVPEEVEALKCLEEKLKIRLSSYHIEINYFGVHKYHVVTLQLMRSKATEIPECLGNLLQLEKLEITSNYELTTLPNSLGKLTQLRELKLDNNIKLSSLPEALGHLPKLEKLEITGHSELTTLPNTLETLTQLRELYLHNNPKLSSLPESLGHLPKLEELLIGVGNLTVLPRSITKLARLYRLRIIENKLVAIPDDIDKLESLKLLNLSFNQLTSIPETIKNLKKLELLNVVENPMNNLSIELKDWLTKELKDFFI